MRTLLFWLLVSASVSAGFALRRWSGLEPLGAAEVISVVVVIGFAALLWAGSTARWARAALCVAVMCLATARGLYTGAPPETAIRARHRGPPGRTRWLEAVASSVPGPTCVVDVRSDAGQDLRAALPADLCPLALGDRVVVPADELIRRQGPERDPQGPIWFRLGWAASRARGVPCRQRDLWAGARTLSGLEELGSCVVARVRQAAAGMARGDRGKALVVAATLGLTRTIPPQDRATLRRAGLGHLIAISGLHLGVGALVTQRVLRWLMARWANAVAWSMLGAAIPLAGFVVLSGAGAPALRAGVMLGLYAIGQLRGRPTHAKTTLAIAAAGMLFARPAWLLAPGFQLSMVAMLVLLGLPRRASMLQTSWQLSWGVLPLVWWHFHGSADGAVLANAFVLPMFAYCILPAAVLGWTAAPWAGGAALAPAGWGADVVWGVASWVSSWPTLWRGWWALAAALACVPWPQGRWTALVRPWRPPQPVALAVVLVWGADVVRTAEPQWRAWGSPRNPDVVQVDGERLACVRTGVGGRAAMVGVLDAVGASSVGGVTSDLRTSVEAPHRRDLVDGFEKRGWGGSPRGRPRCTVPTRAVIRPLLARCAAFSSPPHLRAPTRGDGSVAGVRCWSHVSQSWHPLTPRSGE